MRRAAIAWLLALGLAMFSSERADASFAFRVVALSGDPAPGVPGAVFDRFAEPVLDRSGKVSFRGTLQIGAGGVTADDAEGIWSETASGLELVARQGSPAPGAPLGAVFESLFWLLRDDAGQVVWAAELRLGAGGVDETNDRGVWIGGPGGAWLVMREGDPVPEAGGIPVEVLGLPRLDAGALAFLGSLDATQTSDGQALFVDTGAGPVQVARVGEAAPGAEPGALFGALMTPALHATQVLVSGFLRPGTGGVTSDDDKGLWLGSPGALSLIARSGDTAPGTPGALFHRFSLFPSLNAAGDVAFHGRMRPGVGGVTLADEWGLWSGPPSALALVAREGDPAPGAPPGAVFGVFYAPLLNASGAVAFQARLALGPGGVSTSNERGIWTNVGGTLERVALEGDVAPGAKPPEVSGDQFYRVPGVPELNDAGHLVFLAELRDNPTQQATSTGVGIWHRGFDGVVRQVARSGTSLGIAQGDVPTVSALELASGSGGSDGRARSLADNGDVAFRAAFADGREAVLLPEPDGFSGLLAATLGLAALRAWDARRRGAGY